MDLSWTYMGGNKMYEIFFFVNPIGINCYESEQAIINAIDDSKKKVDYHFIPMANMTTIRNDIKARKLPTCDLDLFNRISRNTFNAIKNYHTVKLMKGNKLARKFLLKLQSEINDNHRQYSKQSIDQILNELNVNKESFDKTRQMKYTLFSMNKDLQLAKQFKVETTPTTFIYNYDEVDNNFMIEGKVNEEEVSVALNTPAREKKYGTNNLHLI